MRVRCEMWQENTMSHLCDSMLGPHCVLRLRGGNETSWWWSGDEIADGEGKMRTSALQIAFKEIVSKSCV